MGNTEAALSVQHLTVSYGDHTALNNINFHIQQGRLTGVIGPNGAGKSTLMKAALGLISKDSGSVEIYGKPANHMRKKVAYVPQRNNIDWDFPINVLDTVLLGTYPKLGVFHRPKKADRKRASESLEQVGLGDYKKRQIGELSGGQQQRVFLARALAQEAQLFFLDEPFVGIDASSEETIIRVLKELRDNGNTVIVIHHDLSKAEDYFDDLVLINVELIESGPTKTVLNPETITKAYQTQFPFLQTMGADR
ncbi:metal ABC transporter ATP-binding protein [Virgibacillus sp. NKC19-3]|uniref:metal ABC transporter ATP-binding protein n=1 Tax=Virgibacillus saliphilus TaxID=2831674 RepID=UPI001C9A8CE5|nr:metal ABC transporter ATP-binding protein [Virgibacillus sp. NKC19-3]MBY7144173.1 metal ABC transporter ATP-binding protein [Virgibacillus sp. NKC19-3]